jgi:hypothetical protein
MSKGRHNLIIHLHRIDDEADRAHERKNLEKVTVDIVDAFGNPLGDSPYASDSHGRVEAHIAAGTVLVKPGCPDPNPHSLITPLADGFLVEVESDKEQVCSVHYHPIGAAIKVPIPVPPQPTPSTFNIAAPSPTFKLYRGTHASPEALHKQGTDGVFSDLAAGYWTLVAEMGPAYTPACIKHTFHVTDRQNPDLTDWFAFAAIVAPVTVQLTSPTGTAGALDGATVTLTNSSTGQSVTQPVSSSGTATFNNVPPGQYTSSLDKNPFTASDGSSWKLANAKQIIPTATVTTPSSPSPVQIPVVQNVLTYDITLTDSHGKSIPRALVEVFTKDHQPIGALVLDDSGKGTWIAPKPDLYYLAFHSGGVRGPLQPANVQLYPPEQS